MIFQKDKHKSRMAATTSRLEGEEGGGGGGQAGQGGEGGRQGGQGAESKLLYSEVRQEGEVAGLMAQMEVREGEVADLRVEHASREEEKTYSTYSWT